MTRKMFGPKQTQLVFPLLGARQGIKTRTSGTTYHSLHQRDQKCLQTWGEGRIFTWKVTGNTPFLLGFVVLAGVLALLLYIPHDGPTILPPAQWNFVYRTRVPGPYQRRVKILNSHLV